MDSRWICPSDTIKPKFLCLVELNYYRLKDLNSLGFDGKFLFRPEYFLMNKIHCRIDNCSFSVDFIWLRKLVDQVSRELCLEE